MCNIIETSIVEPSASAMVQSLRSIGYSLETAIADIIDNSISAGAKNIWFNSQWLGGDSYITILDDGCGMNNEELLLAMKPGSKNPLDDRYEKDLGRFGLGLKTASFSQCKSLTVISKKQNQDPVYWIWDLDHIAETNRWELIRHPINENLINTLDALPSGTMVVWQKLDRIIKPNTDIDNRNIKDKFREKMDRVKQHSRMTFHRFIEDQDIYLFFWGKIIEPWNPFDFSSKIPCGQILPKEHIDKDITMRGFILPHLSKLNNEQRKEVEGEYGAINLQGFYIYRGKRLLLSGDWLGLYKKEELYKLARIRIDIPTNLDDVWQIDVKKSKAKLPNQYSSLIKIYADGVRSESIKVFRNRGALDPTRSKNKYDPLWTSLHKDNKEYLIINRDNSTIKLLIDSASSNPQLAIDRLLRLIEASLPTRSISIIESDFDIKTEEFNADDETIMQSLIVSLSNLLKNSGKNIEEIKSILAQTEPINNFPTLIKAL